MSDDWLPPRSSTPPPAEGRPERPSGFAPPHAPGSTRVPEPWQTGGSRNEPPKLPAGGREPNTSATVALILGSIGVVLVLISAGLLFIITLPLCVAGWIVGRSALKQARRGVAGREGLARAAMWIGIGGTGLSVVALIAWTTLLAIDDTILDDIEHEIEEFEREQSDTGDDDVRGRSAARLGVIAAFRLTGLFTG